MESQSFHRDVNNLPMLFVLWANCHPTEVRFSDGQLLTAQHGDAMLLDNFEVEHRVSRAAVACDDRWFVQALNVSTF
jgi:hypothetical protein